MSNFKLFSILIITKLHMSNWLFLIEMFFISMFDLYTLKYWSEAISENLLFIISSVSIVPLKIYDNEKK
jgi:hypothetical protein